MEDSQLAVFKGTYRYRLDPKGRLPVPPAFRKALSGEDADHVVVTPLDQCLAAYPPRAWQSLEEQLGSLPPFTKNVKALTRLVASRALDCALDGQGRILLSPGLREGVGLLREAVVVGVLNRFEVWSPPAWEGFLRESEHLLDDAGLDVPWPIPVRPPFSTGKP